MNTKDIIKKLKEDLVKQDWHGILLEYKKYVHSDDIPDRYRKAVTMINAALYKTRLYFISDIEFYKILVEIIGPLDDLNEFVFDSTLISRCILLKQRNESSKYYSKYLEDFHALIDRDK